MCHVSNGKFCLDCRVLFLFTIMAHTDAENLKELPLSTLEEMLERQTDLLKHKQLLEKLPDKGDSLLKSRTTILNEIESRGALQRLTEGLDSMSVSNGTNYSRQLCTKEHMEPERKFKPFATLVHQKESNSVAVRDDRHEICAALEPEYKIAHTKPVPLAESLQLQVEQVNRIKEEKHEHLTQFASKMIEGAEKCMHTINVDSELIDLED